MTKTIEEANKALVLEAFDTHIQHSTHIPPGREGLFNLIKSAPPTMKDEPGVILADKPFVIAHGRFSGHGTPRSWIAADIIRIAYGVLTEHWDVLQAEATSEESQSGLPMFGKAFPVCTVDRTQPTSIGEIQYATDG